MLLIMTSCIETKDSESIDLKYVEAAIEKDLNLSNSFSNIILVKQLKHSDTKQYLVKYVTKNYDTISKIFVLDSTYKITFRLNYKLDSINANSNFYKF